MVVLVSFVLFGGTSPAQSLAQLRIMFHLSEAASFDNQILYLLISHYLILIISILESVGFFAWLARVGHRFFPKVWTVASWLFYSGLWMIVLAYLV